MIASHSDPSIADPSIATDTAYVCSVPTTTDSGHTRLKTTSSQIGQARCSSSAKAKDEIQVSPVSNTIVKTNHLYILIIIKKFIHKNTMSKLEFTILKERKNARV